MMAHGFTSKLIAELVRAGVATAEARRVLAGGRTVDVTRIKLTDAGRQALGRSCPP